MDNATLQAFQAHGKRHSELENSVAALIELTTAVVEALDLLNRATKPVQVKTTTSTDPMEPVLLGPAQQPRALPPGIELSKDAEFVRNWALRNKESEEQKQIRLMAENAMSLTIQKHRERLLKKLQTLEREKTGVGKPLPPAGSGGKDQPPGGRE